MATSKRTPQEKAKGILANCHEKPELGGCLLWQGPVSDYDEYGYTQFNGVRTRIHKIVALYGVPRTEEQIARLSGLRITWDCGRKFCMKQSAGHMRFASPKAVPGSQSSDILKDMTDKWIAGYTGYAG
jgi:hypothetical protein